MTIGESLKELSKYPVPRRVFEKAAILGGISVDDDYIAQTENDSGFLKAKAHVLNWLSTAPSVSELGVSYSLTDREKKLFKHEADTLLGKSSTYGITYQ